MEGSALRAARAELREAQEAARAHDRSCGTCNVRRRVRCGEGMALVRAIWAADGAVRDAWAASRRPGPGQQVPDLLDLGYLSLPADDATAAIGRDGRQRRAGRRPRGMTRDGEALAPRRLDAMRALSVRHPYAFCIAMGLKPVENRTRPIPRCLVGPPVALHASSAHDVVMSMPTAEAMDALQAAYRDPDPAWVSGAVIAVVRFGPSHPWPDEPCSPERPCTAWSQAEPGIHHWPVTVIAVLPEPVRCKGSRGPWPLPEDAEKAVRARLPSAVLLDLPAARPARRDTGPGVPGPATLTHPRVLG